METSDSFNHMGVAVFHGSVRGRRGDSAGRHCCFMGYLSSPTWTAVGSECLKSGQLHLRVWRLAIVVHLAPLSKVNVWTTAWERSVCVKRGHVSAMWCLQYTVFQKVPWKLKGEGTRDVMSALYILNESKHAAEWDLLHFTNREVVTM